MKSLYHQIAIVVEVRSLDSDEVKPILRSTLASISRTGFEMTEAQARKAIETVREELGVADADRIVASVAEQYGLGR